MGHGTARVNVKAIDPRDIILNSGVIALKTPVITAQPSPPPQNIRGFSPYTQTQVAAKQTH